MGGGQGGRDRPEILRSSDGAAIGSKPPHPLGGLLWKFEPRRSVHPAFGSFMEPVIRRRRVIHHRADPEHLPQALLCGPAGIDPAVINGKGLACPFQQPRIVGPLGGRGGKPEHSGIVGRQDVLRGGHQKRVAGPEQGHPVLAGDIRTLSDGELFRQLELPLQLRRDHHQRGVARSFP